MRQAFVFLLMFMGACFSSFSADIKKASVISDGDRGLALEWVKDLDGDVYADKKKNTNFAVALAFVFGKVH